MDARSVEEIDAALERGEIDEKGWYEAVSQLILPVHLAADTPWGQSGRDGDADSWEAARRLVVDAIDADSSFLDIGCANGYLMECVQRWCADKGLTVEPYGVDIAPELVDLAQRRLPDWTDRFWVGNAIDWTHSDDLRFDVVRTGLEYVPAFRRLDLVRHLLDAVVGYRLVIGPFGETPGEHAIEMLLVDGGHLIAGHAETTHTEPGLVRRLLWIDR